jgi:exodeoxyribonuclease V beta subunit
MTGSRPEFSLQADLPWETTVAIEASAGTGKTYALAGLAVRYVAERGVPVERLLVVTFTRAATAELQDRIRARLVEVHRDLAASAAGDDDRAGSDADPVLQVLLGRPDEWPVYLQRLQQAILDFDSATISTIHGFCSQARSAMGVRFRGNPDAIPSEGESAQVRAACNDALALDALTSTVPLLATDGLKASGFRTLVEKFRQLPGSVLRTSIRDDVHEQLLDRVQSASNGVTELLDSAGLLSFDSLVSSVQQELLDHPVVVEDLRSRFSVALIDEFQDTDAAQWGIFRSVFGPRTGCTLVVVGDPKQAIYSFRGGDVYTYLEAVGSEGVEVRRLAVNQRSDESVVRALSALYAGHILGSDKIVVDPIEPTSRLAGRQLRLADGTAASGLSLRIVTEQSVGTEVSSASARRRVVDDLVTVTLDLLHGAQVEQPVIDGPVEVRPVAASDIAVLVSASSHARPIADALREVGIPSVLLLQESVVDSEAANQLARLFSALDRPSDRSRAAAAALGWWGGWPSGRLAAAADDDPDAVKAMVRFQHQLVEWAELLGDQGLPALIGRIRGSGDFLERMMTSPDGERNLTDLEHLVEMVHASRGRTTAVGAAIALEDLGGTAPDDQPATEAAQRRIESDLPAVRILTIHKAKGLEFPIVLLPSLYAGGKRVEASKPYSYYEGPESPDEVGHRILDVSLSKPSAKMLDQPDGTRLPNPADLTRIERCGDQHRMTYVALTRAAHQVVAWWSDAGGHSRSGVSRSGLTRLLFSDDPAMAPDAAVNLKSHPDPVESVRRRVDEASASEWVSVVEVSPPEPEQRRVPSTMSADADPVGPAARLTRPLPRTDRSWSFSSIHRAVDQFEPGADRRVGDISDPEDDTGADSGTADEVIVLPPEAAPDEGGAQPPSGSWAARSPFEGLGAGRQFGLLVHSVFEHADFTVEPLADHLLEWIRRDHSFRLGGPDDEVRLAEALEQVVRTPLGGPFGSHSMVDLDQATRIDELRFELPLSPNRPFPAADLGRAVARHTAGTPYGEWGERLAERLSGTQLHGVLNGAIDLVMQFPRPDGQMSYSIVDYKTNNLTPLGQAHLLSDYRPSDPTVIRRGMLDTDYALQALLYTVVLHRFLRWRLGSDYRPEVHLGPVGYFFVRGMVGADTPLDPASTPGTESAPGRSGVLTWSIPLDLVDDVDGLLARGAIGEPA